MRQRFIATNKNTCNITKTFPEKNELSYMPDHDKYTKQVTIISQYLLLPMEFKETKNVVCSYDSKEC